MNMEILILVVWLALAYWCSVIADNNGRNRGIAIVMGILFGIFAVIIYAMIGKTAIYKAQELQDAIDERLNNNK